MVRFGGAHHGQRLPGPFRVSIAQRLGGCREGVGQQGQRVAGRPLDPGEWVERQQQRHHDEADRTADQCVDEPLEVLASGGRGQRRDEYGRRGGLADRHRAAAHEDRRADGQRDHHGDLDDPHPDQQDPGL